jgi:predicted nucleotidyltransferase
MNKEHQDLLSRIKAEVKHLEPGAEVIVFGSVARGEETPDSDIDVLILLDKDVSYLSLADTKDITAALFDIEIETGIPISPVIRTRKQWERPPFRTPFIINVLNEGKRL